MTIVKEIFRFHNPFAKTPCPCCGYSLDPEMTRCPDCGEILDAKRELSPMQPDRFYVSPLRQIGLFLSVYAGLQLVSILVALLIYGFNLDDIAKSTIINYVTYALLLAAVIAILWPYLRELFSSFLSPKMLYGLSGVVAIILLNYLYQLCISGIEVDPSINQSSLTAIVKAYPFLSVIMLGLVGPFVEECGYRIGLFGFFRRINIILAYIVVSAVFGLIHIHDWTSLNEWLNYPTYLISGLVMGFLYDKVGFSASYLCHATNNIISVISIIVANGAAQ